MAEIFWYYAREDRQFGPVTSADLKRLASADELSPDDLVWREGMDEWAPALRIKGLFPPREAGAAEGHSALHREVSSSSAHPAPAGAHSGPAAGQLAAAPPILGQTSTAVPAPPSVPSPPEIVSPPPPPAPSGEVDRAAAPGTAPAAPATPAPIAENDGLTPGLRRTLAAAQGILWATCVMVVILGGALFMVAMVGAKSKADQADSAQVSATLFIGAYALARAGERVCLLLERYLTARRP